MKNSLQKVKTKTVPKFLVVERALLLRSSFLQPTSCMTLVTVIILKAYSMRQGLLHSVLHMSKNF